MNLKNAHLKVSATTLVVLLFAGFTAAAEPQSPRAQSSEARVDQLFAAYDREDGPGCVAYAFKDGKVVLNRPYGMADLEWQQPLTTDTVFYMGSTSKQYTSAAIALLILDGKLSLDTDVRDFFPELPDFGAPIRVENLVYHTSGLRDYYGLYSISGENWATMDNQDVVDLMARQMGLNFAPGTDWAYSNSGYVLLAELVQRVSGQPLAQFMDERMFKPLGMAVTRFEDDHRQVVQKRARSYAQGENGVWLRQPKMVDTTGGGGLLSRVSDILLWDENFYTAKVGGPEFIELMQRPGSKTSMGAGSYAFGLFVGERYRGVPIVHHAGGLLGFGIQLMRFPEQHFSSGVLCNGGRVDLSGLAKQIADIYLEHDLGPPEAPVENAPVAGASDVPRVEMAPAVLKAYTGVYSSPEIDAEVTVVLENGSLHMRQPYQLNGELVPVADGEFKLMLGMSPGNQVPIDVRFVRTAQSAASPANGTAIDHLVLGSNRIRVNNFRMDRAGD